MHFAVVDGCLEVTFDGHDTTWGEALSEGDTRELVAMLAPDHDFLPGETGERYPSKP